MNISTGLLPSEPEKKNQNTSKQVDRSARGLHPIQARHRLELPCNSVGPTVGLQLPHEKAFGEVKHGLSTTL